MVLKLTNSVLSSFTFNALRASNHKYQKYSFLVDGQHATWSSIIMAVGIPCVHPHSYDTPPCVCFKLMLEASVCGKQSGTQHWTLWYVWHNWPSSSKGVSNTNLYHWNHLNAVPVIPYIYCSLFRSSLWLIVSKSAERSRYTRTVHLRHQGC